MSVWNNRITADAAFWGIVSGFVSNVMLKALDTIGWIDLPAILDPILVGRACLPGNTPLVRCNQDKIGKVPIGLQCNWRWTMNILNETQCGFSPTAVIR